MTDIFKRKKNNEKVSRSKKMADIVRNTGGILNRRTFNLGEKTMLGTFFQSYLFFDLMV